MYTNHELHIIDKAATEVGEVAEELRKLRCEIYFRNIKATIHKEVIAKYNLDYVEIEFEPTSVMLDSPYGGKSEGHSFNLNINIEPTTSDEIKKVKEILLICEYYNIPEILNPNETYDNILITKY